MRMTKKIGFIGLGAMGKPMATNLLKKGFALAVFDIRKDALEGLVSLEAKPAGSPKEVAEVSDVIITVRERR